jgi:hypothetical protein
MPSIDPKSGLRYPESRYASPLAMLANIDEMQTVGGPKMPTAPKAPGLFGKRPPPSFAFDDPADVSIPSPSSSSEGSSGFTVDGPTDWASEREGFLSRGSSPEIGLMADAMGARQAIDENMFSGRRPDLLAAEQARLAIGGLRNARQREAQQLDPGFAREQESLDDISEADTFMNPRVMGQRQQQRREGLGQARELQKLDIEGKTDPRVLGLLFQQWMQQQKLAGINASGRNPLAGILGGGGAQPGQAPAQGAAPGTPEIGTQRRTRSGQVVVWDGQGWAVQE